MQVILWNIMLSLFIGGAKYLGSQFLMNKITGLFTPEISTNKYSTTAILGATAIALLLYITKGGNSFLKIDEFSPESVIIHNQEGNANEMKKAIKDEEKLKLLADTSKITHALETVPQVSPLQFDMEGKLPVDAFNYSKEVYFPQQLVLVDSINKLESKLQSSMSQGVFKAVEQKTKDNLIEEYRLNKIMMSNIMTDLIVRYQQNGVKDHMFEKFINWFNSTQRKADNSSKELKCLAICK